MPMIAQEMASNITLNMCDCKTKVNPITKRYHFFFSPSNNSYNPQIAMGQNAKANASPMDALVNTFSNR